MTLRNEVLRKSIHLLFLVIPVSMMLLTRNTLLWIVGGLAAIAISVEIMRKLSSGFQDFFRRTTDPLLRNHEQKSLTGATYLILSSFLSILLFQVWIAQVVLLFVIISDGLSALVGKCWGTHQWIKGKTWEGNLTFIITALIIVLLHPGCPVTIGLIGVAAAFVVDVFVITLDDNLTIPLCSGLVMELLSGLIM